MTPKPRAAKVKRSRNAVGRVDEDSDLEAEVDIIATVDAQTGKIQKEVKQYVAKRVKIDHQPGSHAAETSVHADPSEETTSEKPQKKKQVRKAG